MTSQPPPNASSLLSYFEKQRDLHIQDISTSMESVLVNVNALNRSLEGAVAVGKEFDTVSQLWGTFYDGMARLDEMKRSKREQTPEAEPASEP